MRFLYSILVFIFAILCPTNPQRVYATDLSQFEGLSGNELAIAVRKAYAPEFIVQSLPVAGELRGEWPEGWWPAQWPATGDRIIMFVHKSWTDTPVYDMYNLGTGDDRFVSARSEYCPAPLTSVIDQGEGWQVGTWERSNAWQPTPDRCGDLARRLMYIALMYPQQSWHSYGSFLFELGPDNTFSDDVVQFLARWASDDPVDERELSEVAAIEVVQGNTNPFVEFPDLFNLLWGENKGDVFVADENRNREKLKAVYSRSTDKEIALYSPYVPEDATWSVDGKVVDTGTIDISSVSDGSHTLSYKAGTAYGKIKIRINP